MRTIFFSAFTILFSISLSCGDSSVDSVEKKENSPVQKNLEAWRAVSMAFSTGNTGALDTVIADEYIDHTPMGDHIGRDSVKANVRRMRARFKDLKMETIKELADDEFGFFWMHFTGNRIDPKGMISGPLDLRAIQVVKFKAGKAVEHWEYTEMKEVLKMMQHRGSSTADSSKKRK